MARNIRSSYSAIDVLVNNAGIAQDATVERMSVEQWDAVLRTNLDGTFYMTQNLLPSLCEGGRIVMMASVAGLHGVYGKANYCASKAGLLGLTRSLALEVASRSITVNAVCPGVIDTDMVSAIPEKYRAKLIENTPLHRLGNPEEVASLVQFLVSKEAGYITGQAITIDGGLTVSL